MSMLAWMFSEEEWSAARRFLVAGVFWGAVALTYDAIFAWKVGFPGFLNGVSFLSGGRVAAVSRDVAIFGFASCLLIAAAIRFTPRAGRGPGTGEGIAHLVFWMWSVAQVLALWHLSAGWTRGRAWGEAPWPADLLRLLCSVILALAFARAARDTRRDLLSDPPAMFAGAGFVGLPVALFLGKGLFWPFQNPFAGVTDALAQAFLGTALTGFWLLPLAAAAVFGLAPALAGRPLHSGPLAYVALLTLCAFVPFAGPAAFVWGPLPFWVATIGAFGALMAVLPAASILANLWKTIGGRWQAVDGAPAAFLLIGSIGITIAASARAVVSMLGPGRFANLSLWNAAEWQLFLYGGVGAIAIGAAYALTSALTSRSFASRRLSWWHFWLWTIALVAGGAASMLGGLVQGAAWTAGTIPFGAASGAIAPLLALRAVCAAMLVVGHALFAWNLFLTADSGQVTGATERDLAPAATA
jgi:cbb3-type cytochrome oxidase subunit 1